jgi:Plasmid pRiA4b ORF-3-like protein
MAGPKQSKQGPIYQMKITLRDSKPPIWRRLQVSADTSLEKLHLILQIAFGWTDSHLHQFIKEGQYYSMPEYGLGEYGHEVENEKRVKLGQLGCNCSDFQKMRSYLVASYRESTRCWTCAGKKMASLNSYVGIRAKEKVLLRV